MQQNRQEQQACRDLPQITEQPEEETTRGLRYSEEEISQLRRIRRLRHDLGINLAGVEVILHLLKRLEAVQRELEQERNQK